MLIFAVVTSLFVLFMKELHFCHLKPYWLMWIWSVFLSISSERVIDCIIWLCPLSVPNRKTISEVHLRALERSGSLLQKVVLSERVSIREKVVLGTYFVICYWQVGGTFNSWGPLFTVCRHESARTWPYHALQTDTSLPLHTHSVHCSAVPVPGDCASRAPVSPAIKGTRYWWVVCTRANEVWAGPHLVWASLNQWQYTA